MNMSIKEPLKIQIQWSENILLHDLSIEEQGNNARVFTSFAEFDEVLRLGAADAPRSGCYDKIKFIRSSLQKSDREDKIYSLILNSKFMR